jgi:hypothetical protein
MGNFDNIFTKKYRRWYKEGKKDIDGIKSNTTNRISKTKENRAKRREEKQIKKEAEMKVKAEQYKEVQIGAVEQNTGGPTKIIQPLDHEDQSLFEPIDLRKRWRNKLYYEEDPDKPLLRGYDKL